MADQLTYADKNKNAADGSPEKQWRDVDANEIKDKFNQNASEIDDKIDEAVAILLRATKANIQFQSIGSSWNDVTEVGFYEGGSGSVSDGPNFNDTRGAYVIAQKVGTSPDYLTLIGMSYDGREIAIRAKDNGVWGSWRKLITEDQFTASDSQKISDIRDFAELVLVDNGTDLEVGRSFISNNFGNITFANPAEGQVTIQSDSISFSGVICLVQLSGYGFSKYSISGTTIVIDVVDNGGVDPNNAPLNGASILIKTL